MPEYPRKARSATELFGTHSSLKPRVLSYAIVVSGPLYWRNCAALRGVRPSRGRVRRPCCCGAAFTGSVSALSVASGAVGGGEVDVVLVLVEPGLGGGAECGEQVGTGGGLLVLDGPWLVGEDVAGDEFGVFELLEGSAEGDAGELGVDFVGEVGGASGGRGLGKCRAPVTGVAKLA